MAAQSQQKRALGRGASRIGAGLATAPLFYAGLKQVKDGDPKRMKHLEAIVLSMTKEERKKPELMNGTRRARVAKGSGRPISEVNRLLEQFREMQKMMKKVAGGGGPGGGRRSLPPGMFGGMR